jgi:hypothetical protein
MDITIGHWTAADVGLVIVLAVALTIVVMIGFYVVRSSASRRP